MSPQGFVCAELLQHILHGLFHRTFMVCSLATSLRDRLHHLNGSQYVPKKVLSEADALADDCMGLQSQLKTIRGIVPPPLEDSQSRISVNDSVKAVIQTLSPLIERDRIAFTVTSTMTSEPFVVGRASNLQLIFCILALNSIESLRSRRQPDSHLISVRIEQKMLYAVRVVWQDSGPGISHLFYDLNEVFNLGTTTSKDKHGLGLFLARLIAQTEFNGTLLVVNRSPATFHLELPMQPMMSENGS
jgi:C4-dicarboxylate-specific signal transduction histidine kinase